MSKGKFNKNWTRLFLAIGTVAIIAFIMPRTDHQSYSYELNQPWKYPLLTAQFDMPILRDSASAKLMKDSIDRNFVPFVRRDNRVVEYNVDRFSKAVRSLKTPTESNVLIAALQQIYNEGVTSDTLRSFTRNQSPRFRLAANDETENVVKNIDATHILSVNEAVAAIDSIYNAAFPTVEIKIDDNTRNALRVCLQPNIVLDTVTDTKYRNQEYINVNGALGIIKQGQRIVDRGEIVNTQIFTNLNTYTEMLEKESGSDGPTSYFLLGQLLYIAIFIFVLYTFLGSYRPQFFADTRKMVFLMAFIALFVIFAVVMFEYVNNGIYLVPFSTVPVIILIFFDSRTAIFALVTTIMISALVSTFPYQFIFLEFTAGIVATFSITQLSQRSQLLRTAILTFMAYTIAYIVSCMIEQGNLSGFEPKMLVWFALNAVILSFAYILVVVIEKVFGFTSTVTLIELSDINNPLLRKLAEEAPGTFQHSMQVSTLAAEAARAIDANTQLVRTGALYHDIGKMESPVFFTENQHGINPHEGLDPAMSSKKIISHVTGGLALASKYKLPKVIRDFISEHHGKGVTKYFYNTAVNNSPDGDVDISQFRYPGPNPQSKETAILMMADAVEAASRSLADYSQESISNLVDKIIDGQIAEHLFDQAPISLRDISTIKDTFKKRLATIYHSRVAYPTLKKS